jgi:hypothetical protein
MIPLTKRSLGRKDRMKYCMTIALLCTISGLNASEAGGTYQSLDAVLKSESITAAVVVELSGVETRSVEKVTSRKEPKDSKVYAGKTVYSSDSFKEVLYTGKVTEVLKGNLTFGRISALKYTEPFFSWNYILLPDGSKQDILHVNGFVYTGSGKEFDNAECGIGKTVILLLAKHHDKLHVLRAEPYTEAVAKRLTRK